MAFYSFVETRAASADSTTAYSVVSGRINRCRIKFPDGCAGLVRVRVSVDNKQIFPSNTESYFVGDGEVLDIDDDYDISPKQQIKVSVNNTDDTYSHTVVVMLDINPPSDYGAYSQDILPVRRRGWFERLFG